MKTLHNKNICCRHCNYETKFKFVDLGNSPPSNEYLTEQCLDMPEVYYPLQVFVCSNCWLVQTKDYSSGSELFKEDYAYLSSTSSSWLEHCKKYVKEIVDTFEKQTRINVAKEIGQRRAGDIPAIFASVEKAKNILNWEAKMTIDDAVNHAWKWQQSLENKK